MKDGAELSFFAAGLAAGRPLVASQRADRQNNRQYQALDFKEAIDSVSLSETKKAAKLTSPTAMEPLLPKGFRSLNERNQLPRQERLIAMKAVDHRLEKPLGIKTLQMQRMPGLEGHERHECELRAPIAVAKSMNGIE